MNTIEETENATTQPSFISKTNEGCLVLRVLVSPNAKKNGIAGLHQDRLKIRLQAPAVDNKANKALVAFVATLFHVSKSKVAIVQGHLSRQKTLHVVSNTEPDWAETTLFVS